MHINRTGESKLGCLVSLVLLAAAAFFALKFVPPYYNSTSFMDEIEPLVTRSAVRQDSEKKIRELILQVAMKHEQPIQDSDIRIAKRTNDITVEIKWVLPIDLSVTVYNLDREVKVTSLTGSLR